MCARSVFRESEPGLEVGAVVVINQFAHQAGGAMVATLKSDSRELVTVPAALTLHPLLRTRPAYDS